MYLGIDIGGTAVKMGIVTQNGEVTFENSYDVAFDLYETPIFETVKKSIKKFLEESKTDITTLKGIGVSATGQVNSNSGSIIGVGGNIKNWCGTQIKKELEEIYGIKTTVVNDANCMVIAEQWIGTAKGFKDVLAITVGTGIGGGIVVDSKVLLGAVGIAGEIGHFSINSDGIKCACGSKGCYERYGSMSSLVKNVKNNYHKFEHLGFEKNDINGKVIFEEVKKGNALMQEMVDFWIADIGKGLVSLVHIFNPQIIVIGGGVSSQEELFIDKVRKYVVENAMEQFSKNLLIKAAKLSNNAGLVGAVYYNMNN